ncbi:para-aminobenzoate synthetase component 1 [Nakamurella sp. UYEF19]|uniref:chorismate-binding protein n=1 Tax=Nakamurella sp. UYEF19 TaxID=1756392 RepID=UPI0033962969
MSTISESPTDRPPTEALRPPMQELHPGSPAGAPGARPAAMASFGGFEATDLIDVVDLTVTPDAIERSGGWWAVAATFEGSLMAYRFADVRPTGLQRVGRPSATECSASWQGPEPGSWQSSLDHDGYVAGVRTIRERIARGDVYQVNLCRVLSTPLPDHADPRGLAALLADGNPAPYQGVLHTGSEWMVSASPELFLSRSGAQVASSPVKGTAGPGEPFADKDFPENIMITDLVRNDLGRVAVAGSVRVSMLAARQEHPGLAHLVSTVEARLRPEVGWSALLAATFPPGSVSGAPKHTALQVIRELEPVVRGPYCGAIGFIDADRGEAVLAVGIRTFFTSTGPTGRMLNFGTGAGITHSSDPEAEWCETELKAARLMALACG